MLDNILECFPEEDILKADGYDAGVIGIDCTSMRLIYSVSSCIQLLVNDGMEEEEAVEYFNFNVIFQQDRVKGSYCITMNIV